METRLDSQASVSYLLQIPIQSGQKVEVWSYWRASWVGSACAHYVRLKDIYLLLAVIP